MEIKAVTFDVGGTLIEPWPSVGHVYVEIASRHGVTSVTPELLNSRFNEVWNARNAFNDTRTGWEDLVNEVFHGLASPRTCAAFFPELYDRFSQPDAWHVFEDVAPALDTLVSRGIRLGVISNWDERLRMLLRRLNLDRYFDVITVSCEVGFSKPSPVIYEHATTKLGFSPSSILHVGDSSEMDVAGAAAAGFQSLRIFRGADAGKDGIRSLGELDARL